MIWKVVDWIFKCGIKAITIYSEDEIKIDDLGIQSHQKSDTNFVNRETGKGIKIITKEDSEPDFNQVCSRFWKQAKEGEKAKDFC